MTSSRNRRDFIGIAAGTAVALATIDALGQSPPKVEYPIKKMAFDPTKVKGLSETLLVSHYENNYSGAVKRLNAISAQLASLDMEKAAVFAINGLKREELIAANSMIIHELYFDGLAARASPRARLPSRWRRISAASRAGRASSPLPARRWAAGRAGCCSPGRRTTSG